MKKFWLSMLATIAMCVLLREPGSFSYAQTAAKDSSVMESVQILLAFLVSICSRARVILAILAGKLMSNSFVYAEFLYLDKYLWLLRNMMKNFANFTLGFIVLYHILKGLFSTNKSDVSDKPIDIIKKTLIAGVLIQSSWFIMWALLDVSNVVVAAVSSFPASFIESSPLTQQLLKESSGPISSTTGMRIIYTKNTDNGLYMVERKPIPWWSGISNEQLFDVVLPTYDTISWPLVFLGTSIFRFQNFVLLDQYTSTSISTLSLKFLLQAFILLFFTLMLLILFIVNLIRIFFLRFIIICSPLLIVAEVFEKQDMVKVATGDSFDFWTVLKWIFKPVMYVLYCSLMILFVLGAWGILKSDSTNPGKTNIQNLNESRVIRYAEQSSIEVDDVGSFNVKGSLFSDTASTTQSFFSDMIVFLVALFAIFWLIKLTVSGGDYASKIGRGIFEWTKRFAWNLPIVPMAGWVGVSQLDEAAKGRIDQIGRQQFGLDRNWTEQKKRDRFDGKFDRAWEEDLRELLWLQDPNLQKKFVKYADPTKINKDSIEEFFDLSKDISKKQKLLLNDPVRSPYLANVLLAIDKLPKEDQWIYAGLTGYKSRQPIEQFMRNTKAKQALKDILGDSIRL